MTRPAVGLIGGSGLGEIAVGEGGKARPLETPYGPPSDPPLVGRHGDLPVVFLRRHGAGHRIPPHRVNHRANLWALKELGVRAVLATASTGSLRRPIRPGTFVVPHDFVSLWSPATFHDADVVHATPVLDGDLRALLTKAAKASGVAVRSRGVYVQTVGPRLETRAEVAFLVGLGDLVGMTMASEASLASELGIPYACLCSVDNYCNGIGDGPLTAKEIFDAQERTKGLLAKILVATLEAFP